MAAKIAKFQRPVARTRSYKTPRFIHGNKAEILLSLNLHLVLLCVSRLISGKRLKTSTSTGFHPHSANSRKMMRPSKIFLQPEGLERNGKVHSKAETQASLMVPISSISGWNKVPFWREI